ncbi:DUF397 domain-containing protein [Nonomuraea lactucae]|uniref:DUF397 domain-containing protein n=1 Tax=Nonomuraea lactucae TaxID=2249762 RepID=UPI000DE2A549|nr:DUF397 domain-containing protein [Nonomuraea lactucae]
MATDLYGKDISGLALNPLCGGNQQEEDQESCVTLARIPGTDDCYALGDSKMPGAPPLRFTGAELRNAGIDTSRVS